LAAFLNPSIKTTFGCAMQLITNQERDCLSEMWLFFCGGVSFNHPAFASATQKACWFYM
jgi:hypothetical protein